MTSAAAAAAAACADESAAQDELRLAVVVTCFIIIFFTENLSATCTVACALDSTSDHFYGDMNFHCQSIHPSLKISSAQNFTKRISDHDHPRSSVVYNFGRVCLSDCWMITFEGHVVGSSYLHIPCISREYGSSSYMKVIESRSRPQEQKSRKIPIPAI